MTESKEEVTTCPKCGCESGDDWSSCKGVCPMPASPYYDPGLISGKKIQDMSPMEVAKVVEGYRKNEVDLDDDEIEWFRGTMSRGDWLQVQLSRHEAINAAAVMSQQDFITHCLSTRGPDTSYSQKLDTIVTLLAIIYRDRYKGG